MAPPLSLRRLGSALGAAVLLVLAAKALSRLYWDPGLAALAGDWVPPDLGVFLAAGDDVVHGRDPYRDASSVADEFGYVYPPLLAWVMSPLSAVAGGTAATIWTLLMGASLLVALRLLGVTDWRCYAIALLCPFTRAGFEYGTIGPLLVLLVAATWRLRDRVGPAALSAGGAIAAKLFLWPVIVWFVLTGRVRTAASAVIASVALVLVPWAAIGFAGLAQYPDLLEKAGQRQGYRSYSLVALAEALGTSSALATLISLAVGTTLLAVAFKAARAPASDQTTRDRRSLILVLAASLAFTPIVWSHYLVLLLVPLSLARPRLSGLWLLLLATGVLDLFSWYRASPDGDVLPVLVLTAIVTSFFVVTARSGARRPQLLE
jgi:alpha-1,2-mannosyltransferase